MTKSLKTGGKSDPDQFVYMFERLLECLEREWAQLGLGFTLKESGHKITSLAWVDNVFLLADDIKTTSWLKASLWL